MSRRVVQFVLSLGLVASSLLVASSAEALAAPTGLDVASGGRGISALTVRWNWSRPPRSYQLQLSKTSDFGNRRTVKVAAAAKRPASGRQTYRFGSLVDATRYYVRVRALRGGRSGWSAVLRTSTVARMPSDATHVRGTAGPGAGEVTFSWRSAGKNTNYYSLYTATTPFKQSRRDFSHFRIGPNKRSFTLKAAQTEAAGAGIGVGWSLVWRLKAIRDGTGGTRERHLGGGNTRVMGQRLRGNGNDIRVASYNVRTDDTWHRRAPLVARTIKRRMPGVVLVQELFPSMVDRFRAALADKQLANYRLTRTGPLSTGHEGEHKLSNRILYDTSRYEMTSACPENVPSCYIEFESKRGPDYAPYAKLRDKASGQEFWVVSFHLIVDKNLEGMRARGMRTILDEMNRLRDGLPVIIGGDANSSQLRDGRRPHDELMDRGYYDAASTRRHVNQRYTTHNGYRRQKPSAFDVAARIDLIAALGMPGSARFENMVVPDGEPFPSDHNMIVANLRLPAP